MSDNTAPFRLIATGDGHSLDGPGSWFDELSKAEARPTLKHAIEPSNQSILIGTQPRLIDYAMALKLVEANIHHEACIEAKVAATVGLGHKSDKVETALNDLALGSWAETLQAVARDYLTYGNGYLEVKRDASGKNIAGIYHLPAKDVWVCVETDLNTWHYEIQSVTATYVRGLRFARFGDRDDFIRRLEVLPEEQPRVSEVIHFAQRKGAKSRYYGWPIWIPATKSMEVEQALAQYLFDFFFHGGVPDAILSVLGGQVDDTTWEKIKAQVDKLRGVGNRRKMLLFNLSGSDIKVQLDKIALDGQSAGENQPLDDAQALKIVSAHRVPPLLAGIQIPGKLGAANEMSNSIMAFQALVISQDQKLFSRILANTLGNEALNGDIDLAPEDFLGEDENEKKDEVAKAEGATPPPQKGAEEGPEPGLLKGEPGNGFRRIVDVIDLGSLDTLGRAKQSMAEMKAEGRDLSAGVATRGGDVQAGRGEKTTKPRRAA